MIHYGNRSFRRFATLFNPLLLISLLINHPIQAGWLEAVEPARPTQTLELFDLAGKQHDLVDYRGKIVLVTFWTTWCPPCIEEMPSLNNLHRELKKKGLVILAVNVKERQDRVAKFASRLKLGFPVLLDPKREVSNDWEIKVFPTSYLVDARGRLRFRAIGPVDWNNMELSSVIRRLIDEADNVID